MTLGEHEITHKNSFDVLKKKGLFTVCYINRLLQSMPTRIKSHWGEQFFFSCFNLQLIKVLSSWLFRVYYLRACKNIITTI